MQLRHKSLLAAATATLALVAAGQAGAAGPWVQVGDDVKSGISGLALTEHSGGTVHALVVRDNKKPGDNRIAQLTYSEGESASAVVTPVTWDGAEPIDLEAVEAVPGAPGEYVALASRGLVYHLRLTGGTVKVLDLSPLPGIREGDDFESFALASDKGKLAAVWADRGDGAERPATVFAAPFSYDRYGDAKFGAPQSASFRAPYPTGDVRHVSDISVTDDGRMLVSSASDAGDDGPFDSGVSLAGRVRISGAGAVRLTVSDSPELLGKFTGFKIEALEWVPGSSDAVLGTDDENKGGSVRTATLALTARTDAP
ncbi:hypothetical protein ACGF0K_08915 [Streptomyces sp. NPDC048156]|uniref:hypothetical protein n=1 Tax=Streptomyces sp. NPDC048156 TaxID=3365502 RepID=UPI00371DBB92